MQISARINRTTEYSNGRSLSQSFTHTHTEREREAPNESILGSFPDVILLKYGSYFIDSDKFVMNRYLVDQLSEFVLYFWLKRTVKVNEN